VQRQSVHLHSAERHHAERDCSGSDDTDGEALPKLRPKGLAKRKPVVVDLAALIQAEGPGKQQGGEEID
jgi:hypothetical protein